MEFPGSPSSVTQQSDGRYYATYTDFTVGDAASGYKLGLSTSSYSGTAGESLSYNNGRRFTTYDKDQDTSSSNCARDSRKGGFWYSGCGWVNLNGIWGSTEAYKGMIWKKLTGWYKSVTFSEMKVRFM